MDADRQPHFERILQSIDADVFLFSECSSISAAAMKGLLDAWLPTGTEEGWHTVKDQDRITASIWPHITTWYNVDKQTPTLVDVPTERGGPMLFINSHLSCCAANEARQNQVDQNGRLGSTGNSRGWRGSERHPHRLRRRLEFGRLRPTADNAAHR